MAVAVAVVAAAAEVAEEDTITVATIEKVQGAAAAVTTIENALIGQDSGTVGEISSVKPLVLLLHHATQDDPDLLVPVQRAHVLDQGQYL